MIGAAHRYRELMNELLLRRELTGTDLAASEEARFAEALDRCWREMTDEEQQAVEEALKTGGLAGAPADLATVDTVVAPGDHTAPRRAA